VWQCYKAEDVSEEGAETIFVIHAWTTQDEAGDTESITATTWVFEAEPGDDRANDCKGIQRFVTRTTEERLVYYPESVSAAEVFV